MWVDASIVVVLGAVDTIDISALICGDLHRLEWSVHDIVVLLHHCSPRVYGGCTCHARTDVHPSMNPEHGSVLLGACAYLSPA